MNPWQANRDSLLNRIRRDQPYSEVLRRRASDVLDIAMHTDGRRDILTKDSNLSEAGRRASLANLVQGDFMTRFAAAAGPIRRNARDLAAKRAAIKLPEPDRKDVTAEMRRQEIRSFVRGLPDRERRAKALELSADAQVATALIDAPAALSGLTQDVADFIQNTQVEAMFGPQLRELASQTDDVANATAVCDMVRSHLLEASGLTATGFEAAMQPLEAAAALE